MFQYFLNFMLLCDFKLPLMVIFLHVFEDAPYYCSTILVVADFKVDFCSFCDFLNEESASHCKDQGEAKVWVELLLFKGGF